MISPIFKNKRFSILHFFDSGWRISTSQEKGVPFANKKTSGTLPWKETVVKPLYLLGAQTSIFSTLLSFTAFLKIDRKQSLHLNDIIETFDFVIENIVSETLENNNEEFRHVYEQISKGIEQFLNGFVDVIGMRRSKDLTDFYANRGLVNSKTWCRYEVKRCRRMLFQL